jgi:lon-related putative ATP-dependent protease
MGDGIEIPGQERAIEAIHYATDMDLHGFNVFVLGPSGSGRHSFVSHFLESRAAQQAVPSDWCYVNNFDDPRRPKALALPPGMGKQLRSDVQQAIQDAQSAIPVAFESEDYQTQHETIGEEFKELQEKEFMGLEKEARQHDIGVIQTPTGIAFVPLQDDEAINPEEFEKLPESKKQEIQKHISELTRKLQHITRSIPKHARNMRQKLRKLERDVTSLAVAGLIDDLVEKYKETPVVVSHLRAIQADIVDNVDLFLRKPGGGFMGQVPKFSDASESAVMRRYSINVLVDRSDAEGAPIVIEGQPSFTQLIGKIEHQSEFGSLVTDFSLIRPGALHRANGGYLILDAAKVLTYPSAWEVFKLALKSSEIRIRSLADDLGFISTVSLDPEPIPLNIKVILVGERIYYYLLSQYDPEFSDLFKIAADFEDQIGRDEENVRRVTRLYANLIREEKLRHLSSDGVARMMEASARAAGDSERLSADIRQMSDLLREAHYWAVKDDKKLIGADEVQRAIDSRNRRSARYRDRLLEETLRETFVVHTTGSRSGLVNGLAVMQLGDYAFGHPQRISATVSLGSGKVIDIEREVELGGPIHSKGVLILSGFLSSHYVTDSPLCLSASLVFEQSYGGVEGDSASAAELCALISALAEIPIKQSLAVTGSVDQHGNVQAIGGVNEKIEGFFDICHERGLSGEQGVLIPMSNVKHLMLKREVIEAVDGGKFHIYPVDNIDRCLQLLTGVAAGQRDEHGEFPDGSVNQQVCKRLLEMAARHREFATDNEKPE